MRISRHKTSFGELKYECVCGAEASEIPLLSHTDKCPCTGLDNVPEVPDGTQTIVISVLRTLVDTMRDEDRWASECKDPIRDVDGVRWVEQGTTSRLVVGLGRTNPKGQFHLDDDRGLVLKVDPTHRLEDRTTPRHGNFDEIRTWEKATKTETDMFFADIIDHAADGTWLLMEECIPIYPRPNTPSNRDAIYDREREYIDRLRTGARSAGWTDPDWKHGNIGLTDRRRPVFIDYGTGPTFSSDD